jgi:hypothetical protein
MNKRIRLLGCLTIFILNFAAGAIAPAGDMTGTWVGALEISEEDTDQLTLVLTKSAAGYAGIINDTMDFLEKDTRISDVKAGDQTINFTFKINFGTNIQTIEMGLTLHGDKLTGTFESREKRAIMELEFVRKK